LVWCKHGSSADSALASSYTTYARQFVLLRLVVAAVLATAATTAAAATAAAAAAAAAAATTAIAQFVLYGLNKLLERADQFLLSLCCMASAKLESSNGCRLVILNALGRCQQVYEEIGVIIRPPQPLSLPDCQLRQLSEMPLNHGLREAEAAATIEA
jgi:hypothetical protein